MTDKETDSVPRAKDVEPDPRVALIEFTGKGRHDEAWHAADLMIFTKSTRLNLSSDLLQEIKDKSYSEKMSELQYMAKTIPSSWEFIDVTFLVSGVTRACAQQMTRTRTGSYAMQSQRVVNVKDADVRNPVKDNLGRQKYEDVKNLVISEYNNLVNSGVALEDARGILPMNIHCNLCAKYNFRSFVELVTARQSLRTQDEYSSIIKQMKELVTLVWPWSDIFFVNKHQLAIKMLEDVVGGMELTTGSGVAWEIAKAIDLLRKA